MRVLVKEFQEAFNAKQLEFVKKTIENFEKTWKNKNPFSDEIDNIEYRALTGKYNSITNVIIIHAKNPLSNSKIKEIADWIIKETKNAFVVYPKTIKSQPGMAYRNQKAYSIEFNIADAWHSKWYS